MHVSTGGQGVDSAHFDNDRDRLLMQLEGIEDRTARFVCVIALMKDGELVKMFRGEVEGRVTDKPIGPNGFGYDPLFFYEPFGCTFQKRQSQSKKCGSAIGRRRCSRCLLFYVALPLKEADLRFRVQDLP